MILSDKNKQDIRNHALSNPKIEVCGLIVFNGDYQVVPCKNISSEPIDRFVISPRDYLRAYKTGKIMGYYHSHCNDNNTFTMVDDYYCKTYNLKSFMYNVKADEFHESKPSNYVLPYVGREFEIGVNDCYTVIKDYYQRELKITLGDYERKEGWYKTNPNLYPDQIKKESFIIVKSPQKHDIIFFNDAKKRFISHAGVFLGEGMFLHHEYNKYSNIEPYDEIQKEQTAYYIRHQSL